MLPAMESCNGCGFCCQNFVVETTPAEAQRIREYAEEHGIEWQAAPANRPLQCGFLREDGDTFICAVWPVRPYTAQSYGLDSKHRCDLFPDAVIFTSDEDELRREGMVSYDSRPLGEWFEPRFIERMRAVPAGRLLRSEVIALVFNCAAAQVNNRAALFQLSKRVKTFRFQAETTVGELVDKLLEVAGA